MDYNYIYILYIYVYLWFVYLVYSFRLNILFGVLFSYYRTAEKRTKWPLINHSWNMIDLKIIALFLSSFWFTIFIFLSQHCKILSAAKKVFDFLFSDWLSHVLCFYFPLFSQMLATLIQEWKYLNSISHIKFSQVPWDILSCRKEITRKIADLNRAFKIYPFQS